MASNPKVETVTPAALATPPSPVDPMARRSDETAEQHIARLTAAIASARQAATTERVTSGTLGDNIAAKFEGNTLTLTIDLSRRLGPSKSGKSVNIATTGGNVDLGDGKRLGLNLFTSAR